MTKTTGLLAALMFPAVVLTGVGATPALAQEKKAEQSVQKAVAGEATIKEIEQNDKLRVFETTFKPGDVSPRRNRPTRAVHALKGGTLERAYTDGTKETVQWKTGDTRILSDEKRPYTVKNVGKGVVHLLIVEAK